MRGVPAAWLGVGLTLAALAGAAAAVPAGAQDAPRHDHGGHAPTLAQPTEVAALDALAAITARQVARYADRSVAVADGYRRIGTDFPGMGEHWLHPAALLAGTIDPARPTLLAYATIGGRPVLLGVGFVITTRGDAPADVPGWPHAWHEHSGLLAHESGAAPAGHGDHAPGAAVAGGATATRVWVLHAWTGLENPGGRYAPDHWALPLARAGVPPPPGTDADVGRAVALAVGGDAYLRDVLSDGGLRNVTNAAAVDSSIGAARAAATAVMGRARHAGRVGAADVTALRATWSELGRSLRARLGSAVDPYLAPPHPEPHAAPGDASPSVRDVPRGG
jgi:hypothetical protein